MVSMETAHQTTNTSGLYQIQKVDKLLYVFIQGCFSLAGGTEQKTFVKMLQGQENQADT